MSNRLTIREIAGPLSQTTGKSREEIETFIDQLSLLVSDHVFADRLVQVKGIGTFKIIKVEKRESIDVNTKERIVIPEHYKLTFTPDKEMREVVNKPFALFESIEIADDADILVEEEITTEKEEETEEDYFSEVEKGTTASINAAKQNEDVILPFPMPPPRQSDRPPVLAGIDEVIGLISDINKVTLKPETPEQPEIVEQPEQPEIVKPPEIVEQPETSEIVEQEDEITEHETPGDNTIKEEEIKFKQRISIKEMVNYNENSTNRPSTEKEEYRSNGGGKNNTLIIIMSVAVALLIVALVSVLFIARDSLFISNTPSDNYQRMENRTNQFSLPEIDNSGFEDEWRIDDDPDIPYEELDAEAERMETGLSPKSTSRTTAALRTTAATTVRVSRGDRLNLFALKYYGNKVFWVYIYQHNQSKLTDPDNIPVGIELQIPASSEYNIDAGNPASVRKASVLQSQILSSYRRSVSSYVPSSSYGSSSYANPSYGNSSYANSSYGNSSYGSSSSYGNSSYGNPSYGSSYGNSSSYGSPSSYGNSSSYGSSSSSYGSQSYPSYQGSYGTQPSSTQETYGNQYNYDAGQSYGGSTYNSAPYNNSYDNSQSGSYPSYDNTNTAAPLYNTPSYGSNNVVPYY
jgi:nucleoid DNA-binding protein/nucleoid-associated protein YgaU